MAYFPNGCAGDHLEIQCDDCVHGMADDIGCPIALIQMEYNYKQSNTGNKDLQAAMTILIDDKGDCVMYKLISKYLPNNTKQQELF